MSAFLFYLHATWLVFVGYLMRRTFGVTPEKINRLHRELKKTRIERDRLQVQLVDARAERDAFEALASKLAGSNAPTLPSMRAADVQP